MTSDIEVGKKIRSLRKIRGISLQQMASETGMSYSYLSGLENGKHSVSIANLQRVASFFGIDMVYFLQPSGPVPKVMRFKDLFEGTSSINDIFYRVTTPADSTHLQVSYVHMPPNAPSERRIHKHNQGQEMILVIQGIVYVMIEGERFKVEQGDSILFEANREHLIFTEDQASSFILISSPPQGQQIT